MLKKIGFLGLFLAAVSLSAVLPDASLFLDEVEKQNVIGAENLLADVKDLSEAELFTAQITELLKQKYKIKINKKEIAKSAMQDISYHQLVSKTKQQVKNPVNKYILKKTRKKFGLSFNVKKADQKLKQLSNTIGEEKTLKQNLTLVHNFQSFLRGIGFTEERNLEDLDPELLAPFTKILTGALLCHVKDSRYNTTGLFLIASGVHTGMKEIKAKEL